MEYSSELHLVIKNVSLKINNMIKFSVFVSLFLAVVNMAIAKTITGKVTESGGIGLPGVTIVEKGTSKSTVTDFNGLYTIKVDEDATLVYSYKGFVTQKRIVGTLSIIDVVLKEDISDLEEVTVVGYQKKEITGAITKFSRPKMMMDSRAINYSQKLQGRVAGVHINHMPVAPVRNTESYAEVKENGFKSPLQKPLSTFSIDVDAASYSNVRRFIMNGERPPKDAVRVEEMINYFTYNYPQPKGKAPFSINYEVSDCPWNTKNKLVHIGLQGKSLETKEAPPSNLVFLIDVSGSMSASNKLPLLKKAFGLLVRQLREKDKVSIVVYAGSSGLVLPPTSGANKEKILNALNRLQSGGATAGAAGLRLAYQTAAAHFIKGGNNRIIIATDGDFNVGQSSDADLEKLIVAHRNKGIYVTVTGFGMGNYKDSKMEIIADKGNGNYAYIDNLLEAKKVFINEFSSTLFTIAKDVKIQIEFNPTHVKKYRLIGYENRLLNDEDFANDKKDAGELGAGHSVTALYEVVTVADDDVLDSGLKYQIPNVISNESLNKELATVKFRYKKPNETKSKLLEETIVNTGIPFEETSPNFQFSSAVAGFGMLLKNSEYKGDLTYNQVIKMAKKGKEKDEFGYRSEFIRLAALAAQLPTVGVEETPVIECEVRY